MRVLVVHGSKMGGTAGIAEKLGEALSGEGFETTISPADSAPSPDNFDAVLVGGALYASRWHRAARRYVRRNRRALKERPVWLFSSGPLDDTATETDIAPTKQVTGLVELIGAQGHITFGGRLPADARGFPASAMAKEHAGDWRDEQHIRSWASGIADELRTSLEGAGSS